MKVLFIPYNGGQKLKKATIDNGVTQNQHAAREYHRHAKLRKARNAHQLLADDQYHLEADKHSFARSAGRQYLPQSRVARGASLQTMIGISRTDPFTMSCVSDVSLYVHEMLDHAITYQWSEFCVSDGEAGLNIAKAEIMQPVMTSPVAWYTVIFAGATHNAYRCGSQGPPKQNKQLRLLYKRKAISCLLEDVRQNGDMVSDATLLSMITLAAHGSGENLRGANAKRQSLPFLSHVHDVEYYASMDTGWEHLNAVQCLLDRRGGLQTVQVKSLAICIQLYDIYSSWKRLQPPHFKLLAATKYFISLRSHQPDTIASGWLRQLTTGFGTLPSTEDIDCIRGIANHASIFSTDFDQLLRTYNEPNQRQKTPNIALVRFTRWCVLHDILMLSRQEIDNHNAKPGHILYELCRHILLAYALFVLVPMPAKIELHKKIADMFEAVLNAAVKANVHLKHPDLFLCASVWSGMCTNHDIGRREPEKLLRKTVAFLRLAAIKMELHAWPIIAGIMKSYLWLNDNCEEPGLKFWARACELMEKAPRLGQEMTIE